MESESSDDDISESLIVKKRKLEPVIETKELDSSIS